MIQRNRWRFLRCMAAVLCTLMRMHWPFDNVWNNVYDWWVLDIAFNILRSGEENHYVEWVKNHQDGLQQFPKFSYCLFWKNQAQEIFVLLERRSFYTRDRKIRKLAWWDFYAAHVMEREYPQADNQCTCTLAVFTTQKRKKKKMVDQ